MDEDNPGCARFDDDDFTSSEMLRMRRRMSESDGWIGINNIDEDQNWVWPDSCPSTYGSGSAYDIRGSDQWCDNQPCVGDCDGYGDDQHCAFLNWDYAHTCNWVDAGCDADIPCVCGDGHVYATLGGVTLFDQHLVDTLAFTRCTATGSPSSTRTARRFRRLTSRATGTPQARVFSPSRTSN